MFTAMRYASRAPIVACAALVAMLVLVGCGSSGGSGVPLSGAATSTPASSSPAPFRTTASSAPVITITCAPARSARPAAAALRGTLAQLRARARNVGIDARVTLLADGSFRVGVVRTGKVAPAQLCADTTIAFRPVILAASAPTGTASGNPLGRLGFALPHDESAYLKLPAAHRRALEAALRSVKCAGTRAATGTRPSVGCDADGHAYLLAAPLFDGSEITDAQAAAPNASGGTLEWAVQIDVNERARSAMSSYTSAHNFGNSGAPTGSADACGATEAPCADFIAVVIDGAVRSVPATASPIMGGAVQITGMFTEATATALAAQLQTPLSVPLLVVTSTGGTATPRPSRS
jgi:preprotein translocase subunit SecD